MHVVHRAIRRVGRLNFICIYLEMFGWLLSVAIQEKRDFRMHLNFHIIILAIGADAVRQFCLKSKFHSNHGQGGSEKGKEWNIIV